METSYAPQSMFAIDFSQYKLVGFHATSSEAGASIEANGFLPHKIFSTQEHERLITIAASQGIDTSWHEQWLKMRSVTFAKKESDALNHIDQGSAGGQALKTMAEILGKITGLGDGDDANFTRYLQGKIEAILSARPVVYAVDLSNLGLRLTSDHLQPLYYFRWNPEEPLPLISEIGPSRIIKKLCLQPKHGIA